MYRETAGDDAFQMKNETEEYELRILLQYGCSIYCFFAILIIRSYDSYESFC